MMFTQAAAIALPDILLHWRMVATCRSRLQSSLTRRNTHAHAHGRLISFSRSLTSRAPNTDGERLQRNGREEKMDKIHLRRCQDLRMWCMNLSPASNPHQEHVVVHELNTHGALLLHSCTHRVETLGERRVFPHE